MKTKTIERYLDECGVTPGPWKAKRPIESDIPCMQHWRVHDGNDYYECEVHYASYESAKIDAHILAASHESLKDWIQVALLFDPPMRNFTGTAYYLAIKNIESALPGRTWPEIKARLEEIEEEEK